MSLHITSHNFVNASASCVCYSELTLTCNPKSDTALLQESSIKIKKKFFGRCRFLSISSFFCFSIFAATFSISLPSFLSETLGCTFSHYCISLAFLEPWGEWEKQTDTVCLTPWLKKKEKKKASSLARHSEMRKPAGKQKRWQQIG